MVLIIMFIIIIFIIITFIIIRGEYGPDKSFCDRIGHSSRVFL